MISTTLAAGAKKFIHGFVDYIWFFEINHEGDRFIITDRHENIEAGSRGDMTSKIKLPLRLKMNSEKIKIGCS